MTTLDRRSTIERYFATYVAGDRAAIEDLLSPEFHFTSPYDDHIDRERFFERCWSHSGRFKAHDLRLVLVDGDDAVVHYDAHMHDGGSVRNMERFHFDGERIKAIEVFFGLPAGADAQRPEEAIQGLLDQREDALEMKDARLVAAKHAPGTVTFSLAPPLVAEGDAEAALTEWFKGWRGMLEWETRDVEITASGEVAFVSALERMAGTKLDEDHPVDLWFRTTLGLKKTDGEWKITHEHQSVPFYMDGSYQAAIDLKPESSGALREQDRSDGEMVGIQ